MSIIKTLVMYNLAVMLIILTTACSDSAIKPLTPIQKAQRLLEEQRIADTQAPFPVSVNYKIQNKAVIEKPMEIELELIPKQDLTALSLSFQATEELSLEPQWYFFDQASDTVDILNPTQDTLYRQKIVIIPKQSGLLKLEIYLVAEQQGRFLAHILPVYLSIGDPLTHRPTRITTHPPTQSSDTN